MNYQQLLDNMLNKGAELFLDMSGGRLLLWGGIYSVNLSEYIYPDRAAEILMELTASRAVSGDMLKAVMLAADQYFIHHYGRSAAVLWRYGIDDRVIPAPSPGKLHALMERGEMMPRRLRMSRTRNDKFRGLLHIFKDYAIYVN